MLESAWPAFNVDMFTRLINMDVNLGADKRRFRVEMSTLTVQWDCRAGRTVVSSYAEDAHGVQTYHAGRSFNVGCKGSSERSTIRITVKNTYPPGKCASNQDGMACSQYAEIYHRIFEDGREEPFDPDGTVLRNWSVLYHGVVKG